MSASDFTLSMIFVFERSFAVGFCPSIQLYSALMFAKGRDPPSRGMRKDSRETEKFEVLWSSGRLLRQLPRPAHHHPVSPQRLGAVHRRVGAAKQVVFLL